MELCRISNDWLGESYYDITHKSGLRIFVFPKKLTTFYAVLGTRFGGVDHSFIDENGKRAELPVGTAHFLEHKLFDRKNGSSDETFSCLGAEANAYTSYSTTRYLFSTTENFHECLAELMRFMTEPYFTKKSMKKEQGIIGQEIKMYADNPYAVGNENMLRGLYQKSNLKDTICGSIESISKITDKTLYSAHRAFYAPENMALSVCGNVTPESVLETVDRALEGKSFTPAAKKEKADEPSEVASAYIEQSMRVARPIFFLGMKDKVDGLDTVERRRRSCAMTLTNNMLFSSSGEFYNRLLSEKLISPGFSFGYTSTRDSAYESFSGETDHPEKVVELIREKIASARRDGLSREDFERCRRVMLSGYIRLFDSSEEIADDVVLNSWFSNCAPFSTPEVISSVTLERCEQVLREVLDNENQTLSIIKPLLEVKR